MPGSLSKSRATKCQLHVLPAREKAADVSLDFQPSRPQTPINFPQATMLTFSLAAQSQTFRGQYALVHTWPTCENAAMKILTNVDRQIWSFPCRKLGGSS